MKTKLTHEESQHLIDLGVPKEKASEIECDQWTNECTPIFTLTDLFVILPISIRKDGRLYSLLMTGVHGWIAGYYHRGKRLADGADQYESELIDALYELACWYYREF